MDKQINIEKITVGQLQTNCYLLVNKQKKIAILIDAGDEPDVIKAVISRYDAKLEAILLTHGHIDHIGALASFQAPIFIHEQDINFLREARDNLSAMLGIPFSLSPKRDIRPLHDGQILKIADFKFNIMHTPGHTPGSISIGFNSVLFTGDALFAGSIGRTDLPYGSSETLIEAIKHKLLPLADDTIVFSGHGPDTTIGEEKKTNPFL